MEISLDALNEEADPYQTFLDTLKSPVTYRKYKNEIYRFLKLVPSKIYQDTLGKVPTDREPKTLSLYFVELAKKRPDIVLKIMSQVIKNERELVQEGKMSPNTLPNHIKPIRSLLDANGVPLHWKTLYKMFPRAKPAAEDRAYTREEIQKMLEVSRDITDKVIILMFSSGGFRLESWDYFTWKDVIFFQNKDGSYKGAALLIYRNDPESYWTFLTPECCRALANYKELWRSQIGRYPRPDDPLIKAVKYPTIRRLNALGVKTRVTKVVKAIGLRPPLPAGKRRHEVQLDHGFRKFCNTMMRRAKVNYLDKEDILGHSVGLERHYERYNEEDFERFPEYQKAIPFLTISDEERTKIEIERLRSEKTDLEKKTMKITELEEILSKVIHKLEVMEKTVEKNNSN